MVEQEEVDERGVLLQALKGYLEELKDTGVDELIFEELPASSPSPVVPLAAAPELSALSEHPAGPLAAAGTAALEHPAYADTCSATGNLQARLLFVMTGAGFVGEAGELLKAIVKAMGFAAEDVHLVTFPLEPAGVAAATREELVRRISAVHPEIVVALGEPAAQLLLDCREPIAALRGSFHDLSGIPLLPSLHPEALVADPALKREVWNEMKKVMARLAPQGR